MQGNLQRLTSHLQLTLTMDKTIRGIQRCASVEYLLGLKSPQQFDLVVIKKLDLSLAKCHLNLLFSFCFGNGQICRLKCEIESASILESHQQLGKSGNEILFPKCFS